MKKQMLCAFALVYSVALAGCSSNGSHKAAVSAGERCKFPGTRQLAPGWVCDEPVPDWVVSAPGYAEKTAAGLELQKQQAAAAAKIVLLRQVKSHVSNMVKQFAETTGTRDTETVAKVSTSVTNQITDQTLVGSKLIKSALGPDGRLWVLAGIDSKGMKTLTKMAAKDSYNYDQALWQKFQGMKSQDELADAIAAQMIVDVPAPSNSSEKINLTPDIH